MAEDLQIVDEEVVSVLRSLEEGQYPAGGPRRNREINGLRRALHALRQARTKVEPDLQEKPKPPGAGAPEGSKPSA